MHGENSLAGDIISEKSEDGCTFCSHPPPLLSHHVLKQLRCIRSLMREEIPSSLMDLINHLSTLEV